MEFSRRVLTNPFSVNQKEEIEARKSTPS